MIVSAPSAIPESLILLVSERTRRRRARAAIRPTGTSTNTGAIRFPMSPSSLGERTDTGTIARSVLPFVSSPLCSNNEWTPPATAVNTTSLTVPPSALLIARNTSNGRSAVANRRLGPTLPSNGPRGGVPIPATVRRASAVAAKVSARIRGCRATWLRPWSGWNTTSSIASRIRSCIGGAGSGDHTSGAPSGASGARSNNADAIIIPPIPSAIAWWSFKSTAVRSSARSSKT